MKIGIDIDGVIVDFLNSYLDIFEKKYGRKEIYEKIYSDKFWECLNITQEEAKQLLDYFDETEYFENMKFIDGAKEAIGILLREHEVVFITARPLYIQSKTDYFFKKHFEGEIKIVFSNEFVNNGLKSKGEICMENNIEIMIEDNKDYAKNCADKGVKVLLMNHPWNKEFYYKNVTRINNWKEAMSIIKNGQN